MNILKKIQEYSARFPNRIAVRTGEQSITYGELWNASEYLGKWILEKWGEDRDPVAVYGHKDPWMLVCFLACVKAGRAYCPIDITVPGSRVEMILEALPSRFVFAVSHLQADPGGKQVIEAEMIRELCRGKEYRGTENPDVENGDFSLKKEQHREAFAMFPLVPEDEWVSGKQTYYIIFTSGSTGTPKGVQISADCLNHYLDWAVNLGSRAEEKQGKVFLNQAPFSFDLSVMDLYTSLALAGTLYCLEKTVQSDYKALMQALGRSNAGVWVSTPSFAEICLSEPSFSAQMMPQLEVFLFCGETLSNKTAQKLQKRFPEAKIVNTYGPTESTVAVTEVPVTAALLEQENPLPVGRPKPGTKIEIWDEEGRILQDGEKGEIIILGDTVSTGYYRRQDLTEKAFFDRAQRGYHTGDKGYLKDGMLYYCGRMDFQVKLHGYRIELGDIENNLCRLPDVEQAVVLPNSRGGKIVSLTAYVVLRDPEKKARIETSGLKESLRNYLPDYMIPKKIVFLDRMPVTENGKADRKLLGGMKL